MTNDKIKRPLEFTQLPLQQTAEMLRRIAIGLISQLLDPANLPGEPLTAESRPLLLKYLLKDECRALGNARVWKLVKKRPMKRIPVNMRENFPKTMKQMFSRALKGKLKARQWEIAANNRIALALGGTKGGGIPDDLWMVAANAAWMDPAFKLSMATRIGDWLRSREIMTDEASSVPMLHPNTYWILIALTYVDPLKASQWFSKLDRVRVRIGKRLHEEARFQTMVNGWAGYWDQWIIRLATQRWPRGFNQLDARLCKALTSLPLLNISRSSSLCGKKGGLFSKQGLIEKWFDKRDGVKRLKRPAKAYRRAVILNLCEPGFKVESRTNTDEHGQK